MAIDIRSVLSRMGVEPARFQQWSERRILGPISRVYSQHLGVPIVAVTGTNGKTTTVRLLAFVLREAGYRVGMACTDGVARDGRWLAVGDYAGVAGLALAMRGGGVDVLLAETARGGILKHGIGFRRCDVAIVTNVSDDHLGIDGVDSVDQMAAVKARVVDRVALDGVAVLNADDSRVAAMSARVSDRTSYFSLARLPPEVRRGVFVDGGRIVRRSATGDVDLMAASEVALTLGGLLEYDLANALAVLAALDGLRHALPVPDEVAVRALSGWRPAPRERPHAFHLLEFAGAHVLLTHPKNPRGYRSEMRHVGELRRALGYETVVGFVTHVGNRDAAFHRAVAASAASACDHLMVVVPRARDLRGASPEAFIAALEAGIPDEARLPSGSGSCADLVAKLRDDYPGKTLFAFFNTRQHRGVMEICRDGRELFGEAAAGGGSGSDLVSRGEDG